MDQNVFIFFKDEKNIYNGKKYRRNYYLRYDRKNNLRESKS